jgi:hypothetical protein
MGRRGGLDTLLHMKITGILSALPQIVVTSGSLKASRAAKTWSNKMAATSATTKAGSAVMIGQMATDSASVSACSRAPTEYA